MISEEIDSDDVQRRILARMADAIRALEELVRMTALAASVDDRPFATERAARGIGRICRPMILKRRRKTFDECDRYGKPTT